MATYTLTAANVLGKSCEVSRPINGLFITITLRSAPAREARGPGSAICRVRRSWFVVPGPFVVRGVNATVAGASG